MKTMRSEGEELQRAISQRGSRTSGLSAELREQATGYAQRRAAEGASRSMIAAELGVSTVSVGRWIGSSQRAAMVPVHIVAEPSEMARAFEVVTPRGLRVVGLDLDALCAVLARHG